jgi:hypothetical protein
MHRALVAGALLAAAALHVRARRVAAGLDLAFARVARPWTAFVQAVAVMALTVPLFALARRLVLSKARVMLACHGVTSWLHCTPVLEV